MKEQKIIAERIISLCKERHLSYYLLSYRSTVPITTILNIVNCHAAMSDTRTASL